MARSKLHASAAERQSAYRSRVYWQQPPTQKFLAGMAQGVHTDLARALQSGMCSLPADLLGAHAGQTLQNLRAYIEYGSLEAARQAGGLAVQAGESS
jgi:hypothetical protein